MYKHDGWHLLPGAPKTWYTAFFGGWAAVVPENDTMSHQVDRVACPCRPFWDPLHNILQHYAFDGRDLIERLERGFPIR